MVSALSAWVIYDRPSDFPQNAVARRWIVDVDNRLVATGDVIVAPSVEKLRALLPDGLVCIRSSESDDPVIVETWL